MKRILLSAISGVLFAVGSFGAMAGPDESQRALIQKTQDAKKKLAQAQAAQGAERQATMQQHMKMMQDVMAQMQKATPSTGMTPEKMREWIDEHMKLMNEMMSQMMEEHHMMMQDMGGMPGMGKK